MKQIKYAFGKEGEIVTKEVEASEVLKKLIGLSVVVWIGASAEKNIFATAISVIGKLEANETKEQFRVLLNNSTYSYFTCDDVLEVIEHPKEFKDGNKAVIKLSIESVGLL